MAKEYPDSRLGSFRWRSTEQTALEDRDLYCCQATRLDLAQPDAQILGGRGHAPLMPLRRGECPGHNRGRCPDGAIHKATS